jgi:hypothetical protein
MYVESLSAIASAPLPLRNGSVGGGKARRGITLVADGAQDLMGCSVGWSGTGGLGLSLFVSRGWWLLIEGISLCLAWHSLPCSGVFSTCKPLTSRTQIVNKVDV